MLRIQLLRANVNSDLFPLMKRDAMFDNYIVQPVYKALQVLLCLGEERRDMALSEICHRVGLPKTTTFRYLQTLSACGFVTYDPDTDLYRLGPQVWALSRMQVHWLQLRAAALPAMRALRNRFKETINLAVLDGCEIVYVDIVESRRSIRAQAHLTGRDPAYTTALGKAMLAFLPEDNWRYHLPAQLAPRTAASYTSIHSLKDDLCRIRARGYSFDVGENEEDMCCIGAPVYDSNMQAIAAISLSAPLWRFEERVMHHAARHVVQAAITISQRLQHHSF